MSTPPLSPRDRASTHSGRAQTCHLMASGGARGNLRESNLPRLPAAAGVTFLSLLRPRRDQNSASALHARPDARALLSPSTALDQSSLLGEPPPPGSPHILRDATSRQRSSFLDLALEPRRLNVNLTEDCLFPGCLCQGYEAFGYTNDCQQIPATTLLSCAFRRGSLWNAAFKDDLVSRML